MYHLVDVEWVQPGEGGKSPDEPAPPDIDPGYAGATRARLRQIAAEVRYVPPPGAVGSVSKGEGQSRQTDQVEIPFPAATFFLVATLSDPGSWRHTQGRS